MYLDAYIGEINRLCVNHKVHQLFVFGSVLEDRFTENSDIDLIVDFKISDPIDYAESYFALKFSLEDLLGRPIDLLEHKAIRNKYLLQSINKSKKLLFKA
jgi:predicted nucleotidyltransferase